jgi:hypothetical protein
MNFRKQIRKIILRELKEKKIKDKKKYLQEKVKN